MDSPIHPLDSTLKGMLENLGAPVQYMLLPDNEHEEVRTLLAEREPGAVFLPAIWEDLYGIKIIQEIKTLPVLFEAAMCGTSPEPSLLVAAFNEGLGAFLPIPANTSLVTRTVKRMINRLTERVAAAKHLAALESATADAVHPGFLRDQILARALLDAREQRGPMVAGEARALLALTSPAQTKRLESFLSNSGFSTDHVGTVAEAIKSVQKQKYAAVVADGVLPDGTAIDLSAAMRKALKSDIPRLIVWTSSPSRTREFLKTESHIDDVVLKPSEDAGMESILLSMVIGLYLMK